MSDYNNLTIGAYGSGTTRIEGADHELTKAQNLQFTTGYPGGLYLDASFYVPRKVVDWWEINGAQRIVIRNGQALVYEGKIDVMGSELTESGEGVLVTASGYWGALLNRRNWRKIWADNRLTEDIWQTHPDTVTTDKCFIDRTARIRFVPKAEAWTNGQLAAVRYFMPTGQTIKRVTLDYDFQEDVQAWTLRLRDTAGATDIWSVTASGTGSRDDTLGTPRNSLTLQFVSNAAQTPTSDGAIYGEVSNVMVYSETGAINLTEIAKDVRARIADLNSYEGLIGSNTYPLTPFYIDDWQTPVAETMMRAALYGDSSNNQWAVGVRDSELALTPNGKPVLFAEQYPALTDYDYAIRLDENNLVGSVMLERDYSKIFNWIIYSYVENTGRHVWATPDDDASLTNAISVANYGQRDFYFTGSEADSVASYFAAIVFLNKYKDPQFGLNGPIRVKGFIRGKGGNLIPASQIKAGMRIKIENYLRDLSGTGLTLLISRTRYDDESEMCEIESGIPNSFEMMMARIIEDRPGKYFR